MLKQANIMGITGWSGSGKTNLILRLLPTLKRQGYSVSTVKHAHHNFEIDNPGKDSYEHRNAGATEVLISSSSRWALIHENLNEPETNLNKLLQRMSPTDIVLVEGYKQEKHHKIEVHRSTCGGELICLENPSVIAVASDTLLPALHIPVINLNNVLEIADFILSHLRLNKFVKGKN